MPVRYLVIEDDGTEHTRTSAGHTAPRYTHAVVKTPGGSKAAVSYCGSEDLARKELGAAMRPFKSNAYTRRHSPERIGKPLYPGAKIYPVSAEVL